VKTSTIRCAISIGPSMAFLIGCAGSQPQLVAPSAAQQSRVFTIAEHADRAGSWMLPEAKGEDLLYASDENASTVYVFSYPNGELLGTLTGFQEPTGECVDPRGDVFITDDVDSPMTGLVYEFAHGGTSPIATLVDQGAIPWGCSVDRTTGNLAVSNNFPASVAVYKKAQGNATVYSFSGVGVPYYCTYDGSGNLFVTIAAGQMPLAEIPRGSDSIKQLPVYGSRTESFGSIQWDGTYLAADDFSYGSHKLPIIIARIQVSGSYSKIVRLVGLRASHAIRYDPVQFWLENGRILRPDTGAGGTALVWHYPEGGKVLEKLHASIAQGFEAVAVSPASDF
jgi:DNA-binding beta-propeller fold protein YncE